MREHAIVPSNRGDGTFLPGNPIRTPGEFAYLGLLHLIAADPDGDGALDLAAGGWELREAFCFSWSRGDGTFEDMQGIELASTEHQHMHPIRVAAADFDGDGDLDVAVGGRHDNLGLRIL